MPEIDDCLPSPNVLSVHDKARALPQDYNESSHNQCTQGGYQLFQGDIILEGCSSVPNSPDNDARPYSG